MGVRAWSQVRLGRGRGGLYRASGQYPGDQICCGHRAECYPTSADCYVAGQASRYASGHNITTLDVLCITLA